MSSPSPASLPGVDLQPGKPPVLAAEPAGDPPGWAAGHRDALRAVVTEDGSVLAAASGCPTRPRPAPSYQLNWLQDLYGDDVLSSGEQRSTGSRSVA